MIQSRVPFKCTTVKDVMGDLVEMSAVMGLADDICRYLEAEFMALVNTYLLVEKRNPQGSPAEGP